MTHDDIHVNLAEFSHFYVHFPHLSHSIKLILGILVVNSKYFFNASDCDLFLQSINIHRSFFMRYLNRLYCKNLNFHFFFFSHGFMQGIALLLNGFCRFEFYFAIFLLYQFNGISFIRIHVLLTKFDYQMIIR